MELKIDNEFQSKIPPLTAEELDALHRSIMQEGRLIIPIVVWDGVIVDGHNRYKFVSQHPEIKYDIYEKHFDDRNDAIVWICKNQLGRRNLTPEQKKYLVGKQYEAEKACRGRGAGTIRNENGQFAQKYQNDTIGQSENTGERIARQNNMSRISVIRAEEYANAVDLAEEAVPGMKDEILSGAISATMRKLSNSLILHPELRAAYAEKLRQPKPPKAKRIKSRKQALAMIPCLHLCEKKPDRPTIDEELCLVAEGIDDLMLRWGEVLTHNKDRYREPEFLNGMNECITEVYDYLKRSKTASGDWNNRKRSLLCHK